MYAVVEWANKKLNMMKLYFENLVQYCQQREMEGGTSESFFNHYDEVQARLQFLTSVYFTDLSPPKFSKFTRDENCCVDLIEYVGRMN